MTPLDLILLVALGVAFWLLLIRPNQRRRAEQAALVASLAPGAQIMTTAGVFGTVVGLVDDRMRVEVAPGVVIEMLTAAVARVVEDTSEAAAADAESDVPTSAPVDGSDMPTATALDQTELTPQQEADRG
jgi:preprotein translocase subunit YajC